MSRRAFLTGTLGGITGLSLAGRCAEKRPPNVVVIMADDIGYECYGAYGSTTYKTPHFDGLARTGAKFNHAYAQPLCTPSRVKIMTGKYNFRNYLNFGEMDLTQPTFATILRDMGYKTSVVGKWQLSPANLAGPKAVGFDDYCLWHFMALEKEKADPPFQSRGSRYRSPRLFRNGVEIPEAEGLYGPDLVTDHLCEFMKANRDQPFLVYYPMILVHSPYPPTPDSAAWPGEKNDPKHFPDMVAYMDKMIGRIVEQLDDLGLREHTLLIVTGDNGTGREIVSKFPGDAPYPGGKGSMTDAGTRVGFVANWPGTIPAGTVVDSPIDFADVLPTVAEATGAKLPEGIDGQSFLPLTRGDTQDARGWIFMSYSKNGRAVDPYRYFVRDQRWKLYADGALHDVAADPGEAHPASGAEADMARAKLQPLLEKILKEAEPGWVFPARDSSAASENG